MKKRIIVIIGIVICSTAVFAQSPAPDPDTLKDPVKQTDPPVQTAPPDINYASDHTRITPKQIPEGIRRTLESNPQYAGWEKAAIYKSKSDDLFIVEITKADTTKTYKFDKAGRPALE